MENEGMTGCDCWIYVLIFCFVFLCGAGYGLFLLISNIVKLLAG